MGGTPPGDKSCLKQTHEQGWGRGGGCRGLGTAEPSLQTAGWSSGSPTAETGPAPEAELEGRDVLGRDPARGALRSGEGPAAQEPIRGRCDRDQESYLAPRSPAEKTLQPAGLRAQGGRGRRAPGEATAGPPARPPRARAACRVRPERTRQGRGCLPWKGRSACPPAS